MCWRRHHYYGWNIVYICNSFWSPSLHSFIMICDNWIYQVKIRVFRGHTESVNSCNYIDNDTKILSGSSDKTSRIWDINTGELKHHYTGGHEAAISEISINDNSRRSVCAIQRERERERERQTDRQTKNFNCCWFTG